ncbi:MAG: DEAD/DEAH box helicase, partial [Pseudomonadales bacterium]
MSTSNNGKIKIMGIQVARGYQLKLKTDIYEHWNTGSMNVLAVLPTGGGKTFVFSDIMNEYKGQSVAIAHRQELVSQISLSLCKFDLSHRIIAPSNVIKTIIGEQRREFGKVFYDPYATAGVAGVDTLISRADKLKPWAKQIGLFTCDEGHHALKENKWGKAGTLFSNARGLGVTATPRRADGKGLGAHSDGVYHSMVRGPEMREMIENGDLTDYQIVAPPSDFNVNNIKVTASGDYSQKGMKKESKKSHIVGDIVENYLKFAHGKRGICFVTDVETAHEVAANFNLYGIRTQAVSAKTPENVRNDFIRRFRNGELDMLVNVDLFGEGFDVPAVEVVIMARPTKSLAVYMQQFGRVLRVFGGKMYGLVIDHVENWKVHNLPDIPKQWTLDARDKRSRQEPDPELIQLTTCTKCYKPYERAKQACPHCEHVPTPDLRSGPEHVDGDLSLLDVDTLHNMRQAILAISEPATTIADRVGHVAGSLAAKGAYNRHIEKQEAQEQLRNIIGIWAAKQRIMNRPDGESYKRFYLTWGIDVLSAQSLPRAEADKLRMEI